MKAMLKDKENIIREQQEKSKVLNRTIAENESVLMEKQREIKELVKLTLLEKASIDSGDVVQKFHDASAGKIVINDKDWRSLKTAVENMYPGFSAAAMSMRRNSELSIRTAFLLKIGMSNPEIASLTNSPRQTVWNRVEKVDIDTRNTANMSKKRWLSILHIPYIIYTRDKLRCKFQIKAISL